MRIIKFRAWHKRKNLWVHDSTYGCDILGENILMGGWMHGVSLEELNDIHVMQFTGLKDRNGIDIYEGDILQTIYQDDDDSDIVINNPVAWDSGAGGFDFFEDGESTGTFAVDTAGDSEIIGNIYENPELLEKEQNKSVPCPSLTQAISKI